MILNNAMFCHSQSLFASVIGLGNYDTTKAFTETFTELKVKEIRGSQTSYNILECMGKKELTFVCSKGGKFRITNAPLEGYKWFSVECNWYLFKETLIAKLRG